MSARIHVPKLASVDIRQDGERVIVIRDGRTILDLPYDAAQALAKAIMAQSLKAEELAKAAGIIQDSAILMRAGAPLSLTNHPHLLDQARVEAAWNSDLRRYMPGGVKSREVFGTPAIIKHAPPEVTHGDQ